MLSTELIRAGAAALREIEDLGLSLQELPDPRFAQQRLQELGKQWFSRSLSTQFNDLTSENVIWVVICDGDSIVACLGARHDRIAMGDLNKFWANQITRAYKCTIDEDHAPPIVQDIHGHVVYLGDLYVKTGSFGKNKRASANITNLVMLTYIAACQKWGLPDWYYAFITDQHARQGSIYNFRMPHAYPGVHSWLSQAPYSRDDSDWLVAMNSRDFGFVLKDFLRRFNQLGQVDNQPIALDPFDGDNQAIIKHAKR